MDAHRLATAGCFADPTVQINRSVTALTAANFEPMSRPSPRTPVILFGFLMLYIVLQSAWWMWLLVSKDQDVFALQQQLIAGGLTPQLPIRLPKHTLLMVFGEGSVFLVLLLLALWITYRTLRHELALARQQRDFLMATSHELRTPIAALKLHLQTLERSGLDADQRTLLVSNARNDVERLHTLTENILLATRLEEDATLPSPALSDIAQETAQVVSDARDGYGREHRIEVIGPSTLMLMTDRTAYRSVVNNLLENACKYAPMGSLVKVEIRPIANGASVQVSDEGPGIPQVDRQRIFEKFQRGGNEETRGSKGMGLGLFIVRRQMERLGGQVELKNTPPPGSIFVLTFQSMP